jgi:hypothetical protein
MKNFSNQKEQAEVRRILLEYGFIQIKDVIAWADSIISSEPSPDFEIIEISLSPQKSTYEIITLIHKVRGDCDSSNVIRKAMRELLIMLEKRPELGKSVAIWLYGLLINKIILVEDFGYEPYQIEDSYELGGTNISGTEEEALMTLKKYLLKQIAKIKE